MRKRAYRDIRTSEEFRVASSGQVGTELHAATANAASECSALVNFSKSWLRCRTDARSGRLRYPKLRCDIYCVIRDTMQSMDESRLPGESCVSALTEKGIARNCEMRCPFYFPREEFHGDKMARPDIEQVPRYISKIETSPWRGAYRIRQKWHKDATCINYCHIKVIITCRR